MENDDKRNQKILSFLLILLVGLLVFWGTSSQRKINPKLKLAAEKKIPPKEIAVSKEVYNLQDSFANVAEAAKPATVNISIVQMLKMRAPQYDFRFGDPFEDFFHEFFGSPRQNQPGESKPHYKKMEGTGSGVIIDPKGYVLTNYHVIKGADEIKVTLADGKSYMGKVIGKDPRTDLAVVRISSKKEFHYLSLGNSDNIRIGDWAVAIGSPFGLEQTVTVGIISAKRQSLNIEGKNFREMIQTDASINRGNSGGPLLNIKGEVIGINTAIYAPTGVFAGIGFAIPINKAKEILDDLIEKGKVVRGWLGIGIEEVDDVMAKHFGLSGKEGALVNRVMKGSAADEGGLERGDVIIEFDGKNIKNSLALQDIVAKTQPGKMVKVTVIRNGEHKKLTMELGEMPSAPGTVAEEPGKEKEKEGSAEWLGLEVQSLTAYLSQQFDIDENEEGVVVVGVERGSKAEEMGIVAGDLIKAINRRETASPSEFEKTTGKLDLSEGVMFDIIRRGKPLYITYSE